MENAQDAKPADNKPTVIMLLPDDYNCIDQIKQSYGLIRTADCVRLALRETVKQIEIAKRQPAA